MLHHRTAATPRSLQETLVMLRRLLLRCFVSLAGVALMVCSTISVCWTLVRCCQRATSPLAVN
jgi:hypothetical protein